MDSTDSSQNIPLPFGRTSTTVDELHTLVEVDKATALLAENGVTSAEKRVEKFLKAVPSLLEWLRNEGRDFPWRNTTDPWRVYVSEILLQRTRADAVCGIYDDFFNRFPVPAAIREASEEEIRDSVSSLGFVNHRTRTLEDVAQILGEDHGDSVPASLKELQRPWRVGPYSARATMIFAFHEPMALVDTNFARVGERVFGYNMPSQPHKSEEVYQFFDALMPDNPGLCRALNLALLDLADAICTPSDPSCPSCPLATSCLYWKENRR